MDNKLDLISEPSEIDRLEHLMRKVVTPPVYLDRRWLEENNFVAVPVDSACHFDCHMAELLAHALIMEGISQFYAICTEPLENFPRYLRLGATQEQVLTFSRECAHFNFLLVPPQLSFAVMCTVYDYFVVAGTTVFVESAIGCTLAEARSRFLELASCDDDYDRARLTRVAQYYERKQGRS